MNTVVKKQLNELSPLFSDVKISTIKHEMQPHFTQERLASDDNPYVEFNKIQLKRKTAYLALASWFASTALIWNNVKAAYDNNPEFFTF
jgi:hypothetical protein